MSPGIVFFNDFFSLLNTDFQALALFKSRWVKEKGNYQHHTNLMELILSHLQGADIKLKQVSIDHILTKLKGSGIKDLQVINNTYDQYKSERSS